MKRLTMGAAFLVIAGLTVFRFLPSESQYAGKSVSEWFNEFSVIRPNTMRGPDGVLYLNKGRGYLEKIPDPAMDAMTALGADAVPFLVAKLRAKEGVLRKAYRMNRHRLPRFSYRILPPVLSPERQRELAATALAGLGEPASNAIPALIEVLSRPGLGIHGVQPYIGAMAKLKADRNLVEQTALRQCERSNYEIALKLVQQFRLSGSSVAVAICRGLQSSDPQFRIELIRELRRIGQKAPAVSDTIADCLTSANQEVRYVAADALVELGINTPTTLSALNKAAAADESSMVQNAARRAHFRRLAVQVRKPSIGDSMRSGFDQPLDTPSPAIAVLFQIGHHQRGGSAANELRHGRVDDSIDCILSDLLHLSIRIDHEIGQ